MLILRPFPWRVVPNRPGRGFPTTRGKTAWIAAGLLLLVLAGCAGKSPVQQAPKVGPDLSAFAACPVFHGETYACEGNPGNPRTLTVAARWPERWMCLASVDGQDGDAEFQAMEWPDWSIHIGLATPPDSGAPQQQVGLAYDTHRNETVAGFLQLRSENATQMYTWTGPAKGFVQVPAAIRADPIRIGAMILPAQPTLAPLRADPEFPNERHLWSLPGSFLNVSGFAVHSASYFMSLEPSEPNVWFWHSVLNLDDGRQAWHFLAGPWRFSHDGSGDVWGSARLNILNATSRGPDWSVQAGMTPYTALDAKLAIGTPATQAIRDADCRCPHAVPTSLEGIRCEAGLP